MEARKGAGACWEADTGQGRLQWNASPLGRGGGGEIAATPHAWNNLIDELGVLQT